MLDFLNQQTKIIQVESTQNSSLQYLSSSALLLPLRFLDHSSSSFGSGSLVFQIVFSFMHFPNQFFRSSLDLHAFSRLVLHIIFRSFFFFLQIWFFDSSNRLHLHAFSRSILQIIFIFIFVLLQNSSLRNSSSTRINYSTLALELESLRLDFFTELELHRFKMLVS